MNQDPAAPAMGKILVVDDNPIIQRAVYFQFRDLGFKVAMSGDLTQCMSIVRSEKPDVILLDINFPDDGAITTEKRDGYWAISWLRKMEESKNIPIIAISSAKPEEVEARVVAAGAVAFFPKPIDKDKLLAKIKELMANRTPPKPEDPGTPKLRMAS
jgi:CheY-like chemotaxis protein